MPVAEEIARLQTVNDSDGALVGNEMNPHAAEVHYPGQTDALSRNTHVVGLQIDTLRAFLTSEMETLRGCNDIDAADAERIQARVAILRSLVQKTEEMSEALLDQADPETALVLLEENLPMIVQGADQLSAGESEPVVSETIIAMAASIKHLTDKLHCHIFERQCGPVK